MKEQMTFNRLQPHKLNRFIGMLLLILGFSAACMPTTTADEMETLYRMATSVAQQADIGDMSAYLPLNPGASWDYTIRLGEVEPLAVHRVAWPQDNGQAAVTTVRGRFPALVNFDSPGTPRTFHLALTLDGQTMLDGLPADTTALELSITADDLGVFDYAQQVLWLADKSDDLIVNQLIVFEATAPWAPSDLTSVLSRNPGYASRPLFFVGFPEDRLSLGNNEQEVFRFVGVDESVTGHSGQPLLHFARTIQAAENQSEVSFANSRITEDLWFAKGKGLARLVQKVDGHVSMTWSLNEFSLTRPAPATSAPSVKTDTALPVAATLPPQPPQATTLPTPTPPEPATDADFEPENVVYYTARQAWARLLLYLQENQMPEPTAIWSVMPSHSYLYGLPEDVSTYESLIGGWRIWYDDAAGQTWQAILTAWGGIEFQASNAPTPDDLTSFTPQEWVLDNLDAHHLVLRAGGQGSTDILGGMLVVRTVAGRGNRPVWSLAWIQTDTYRQMVVDAFTGELYLADQMEEFAPLDAQATKTKQAWDGGFREDSTDAMMSWLDAPSWYPLAYQTLDLEYVYNRTLIQEKLQTESSQVDRDAASWVSTAVLHVALGDWAAAIPDYTQAIALAPDEVDYRYYRGLAYLVIRDLDKAEADFSSLPANDGNRERALDYVAAMRGEAGSALSAMAVMWNLFTDVGAVPMPLWIGTVPLTSQFPTLP